MKVKKSGLNTLIKKKKSNKRNILEAGDGCPQAGWASVPEISVEEAAAPFAMC